MGTEGRGGTAERIIAAATELLVEEGYAALSMRKIGAKIGLSQAALYRHFKDKAEIVERIVADGYGRLLAVLETLAETEASPDLLLAEGMRAYVDFALGFPSLYRALLLQDLGRAGRALDALSPGLVARRRSFEILAGILEQGMDQGCFARADVAITAQALWAALFGLAARAAIEEGIPGWHLATVIDRHIELLLEGLRGGERGRDRT